MAASYSVVTLSLLQIAKRINPALKEENKKREIPMNMPSTQINEMINVEGEVFIFLLQPMHGLVFHLSP